VDRILDCRERQIEVELTDAEIEEQQKLQEEEDRKQELQAEEAERKEKEKEEAEKLKDKELLGGDIMDADVGETNSSTNKSFGGKELSLLSRSRSNNGDAAEGGEEEEVVDDVEEEGDEDVPGGKRHRCDVGPEFELWQPMRRCEVVLHVLSSDEFAGPFNEPVNLKDFTDYMQYIQV
jgi:hypothetical protein